MKSILKKHPNFPFLIYFIVLLIIYIFIPVNTADDLYFGRFTIVELPTFLTMRYEQWSSRIIIEFLLVFLLHIPKIVWCILNAGALTIVAWCISYLFTKHTLFTKISSILIGNLVPLLLFGEAGWYATTLNYLWPLAGLFISMIPIKNILIEKKEQIGMYPVYIICLLLACNQEQCCALAIGFFLLFSIYLGWKKKKASFIYIELLLALISFVFIMTCPGNKLRLISETANWYPAFANFNFLQKAMLGINNTFFILVGQFNVIYLVLSIVIIAYMSKKSHGWRIISYIPLASTLYFEFFHGYVESYFPATKVIYDTLKIFSNTVDSFSIFTKSNLLVTFLALLTISIICINLYKIFEEKQEAKYFYPILFLAGFLSVVIMGFSPTIFSSGLRTFTFFDYIMVAIITAIVCQEKKNKNVTIIIILLMLLQMMNTLALLW